MRAPDGTITTVTESYLTGITAVSSTDGGATWQPPVSLGSGGDYAFRATIGMTSTGLLAIAWVESDADVRSIQVAISADGGDTWSTPTALPTVGSEVDDPAIGSSSALGFTVVWREGSFDKRSSSTTDGGATWSASVVVTEAMNSFGAATLAAVGDGEIVAVYQELDGLAGEYSIQSRRSTDGGVSWQPAGPVAPSWSGSLGNTLFSPVVSPSPGTLIVAWSHGLPDDAGDALFVSTSTDGGTTWSAVVEIFADGFSLRFFTTEIVDASTVGIVWHQRSEAGAEAFYAEVELGATAASTPSLIESSASDSASYDRLPTLTVFGETRVATWFDEGYDDEDVDPVYLSAVSCDGGVTWRASTVIATGPDLRVNDAVAALDGTVVTAFWSEDDAELDDSVPFASSIDDPCSVAVAAPDVDGPELAATGANDATIASLVAALGMLAAGVAVVMVRRAGVRQ